MRLEKDKRFLWILLLFAGSFFLSCSVFKTTYKITKYTVKTTYHVLPLLKPLKKSFRSLKLRNKKRKRAWSKRQLRASALDPRSCWVNRCNCELSEKNIDCLMKQMCITDNHETIFNFILRCDSLINFSFLLLPTLKNCQSVFILYRS